MPTLLLIEDEAMLRSNVARSLSRLPDMTVMDAGSLEEALPLLDRQRPDIIVSDIDLPRRTGIEVLGELAARKLHIPIVFVTGYLRAYGAQIPRHEGIEVLEKPLSIEDLRATIERRIGLKESLRPPAPFGVPDYMQLAGMGRHSVIIDVSVDGLRVGTVVMVRGDAWAANDAEGGGSEALRRLAFLPGGVVSCRSLAGEPGPRNLDGSWEWVLLEAARSEDERGETPTQQVPQSVMTPDELAKHAFERAWDEGIGALLRKDYAAAMSAFFAAREFAPDDAKVRANIERLTQMGVELPQQSTDEQGAPE